MERRKRQRSINQAVFKILNHDFRSNNVKDFHKKMRNFLNKLIIHSDTYNSYK